MAVHGVPVIPGGGKVDCSSDTSMFRRLVKIATNAGGPPWVSGAKKANAGWEVRKRDTAAGPESYTKRILAPSRERAAPKRIRR